MKEIILTQGKVALVDDEDYEYLNQWKWNPIRSHKNYYAARGGYISGKKKTIFMHRVIMDTPPGMLTDHIDRNSLNNQRSNLRIVTPTQNNFNVSPRSNRKVANYTGVHIYYRKGHKYIKATICQNSRNIHLGQYKTEEDAAIAYNEAAIKIRGEYARLNTIPTNPEEPYMGWCEVDGCNNEGASGGCYWSGTGYWTICSKHGEDCRNGLPQPKMKVEAVEREKNRDPKTGFLRSRLTPQVTPQDTHQVQKEGGEG